MTNTDPVGDRLDIWEQAYNWGRDLSAAELCEGRPELVGRVDAGIRALKRMLWLDAPDGGAGGPAAPSRFRPGDELGGRFRLDERLASGAHGEVWRGTYLLRGWVVAVKVPRPRPAQFGGTAALIKEAETAARLVHANIIAVYHAGLDGETPFIVSRLVEGENLADHARRSPPDVAAAVRLVWEIGDALAYAHRQNVIHRDLKPKNVMVDGRGKAYLTDFGIALSRDEAARPRQSGGTGTANYMAPEQFDPAAALDHRCDLYALGVVFFELLTGRLPFPTYRAKLDGGEPPRPSASNPAVPPALDPVVTRCLARNPADRFASVEEFRAAIPRDAVAGGWVYMPGSVPLLRAAVRAAGPDRPARRVTRLFLPAAYKLFRSPVAPARAGPLRIGLLAAVLVAAMLGAALGLDRTADTLAAAAADPAPYARTLVAAAAAVVAAFAAALLVVRVRQAVLLTLVVGGGMVAAGAGFSGGLGALFAHTSTVLNAALKLPRR